ncbi:phosphate/phosphite/phosphonate ABC transporter substrate-binding protein [Lacticaseibacillus jixianensis]|uniref:Phosphate/phosphite/phosphonate ABC transporter substrate-binding protein n=1 Tax=Lacticaseibacillus jixianensis TaxID=2486012 RepID=A0ABW4B9Q9_9LACO|nr:phosphate/phosphite/phosphonate ABC transporter substrate-binding protein [Lacticaseibacillus jixianensis]
MKQSLKLVLAASALSALTLAGLTGCGAKNTKADAQKKPLTMVFYPNESAKSFEGSRAALKEQLEKATGRPVRLQTTTDYNVAIQALASGKAQIANMGPAGYINAHALNNKVLPIATMSGPDGTLKGASYRSYIMVPAAKADQYKVGDKYSLTKLKGQSFSFVSNTSTSGFVVPTAALMRHFKLKDTHSLEKSGDFFQKVLYGGSHQGSALNVFKGDVAAAAFDDTDLRPYLDVTHGDYDTPGAVFTVKKNAPEPFTGMAGKAVVAIDVLPVQREPWVLNTQALDKKTQKAIKQMLLSKKFGADDRIFSKPGAKKAMLIPKATDQTKLLEVNDAWYKPTHELVGK